MYLVIVVKDFQSLLFLCLLFLSIELVVVPGMAFDKQGHRLGRGKGYYDRLLPKLTNAYKLGVCFPYQYIEEVPTDEHDIRMDEVLTIG